MGATKGTEWVAGFPRREAGPEEGGAEVRARGRTTEVVSRTGNSVACSSSRAPNSRAERKAAPVPDGPAASPARPPSSGRGPQAVRRGGSETLTKEELARHFHLPINDVAKSLGICVTVLKARCREFGIHRWPYRKVKKLDNLISTLEGNRSGLKGEARESKERQLRSVRETKRFLLHNPNSTAHLKLGKVKSLKGKAGRGARKAPPPPGGGRGPGALAATGGKLEAALPQHLPISGASAFSPLLLRGAAETSSSERSNDTVAGMGGGGHRGSPRAGAAGMGAPLAPPPAWGYHPAMMHAMMPWLQASTMMMAPSPMGALPVGVAYAVPPGPSGAPGPPAGAAPPKAKPAK